MNSILITSVVFITIFGEALLGMFVRRWIPYEYLGTDTKDVVRLITGISATMSGVVLGMLVASAKSYFDARTSEIAEIATEVVTIDRLLARYGPETGEIRSQFHQLVENRADRLWRSQESMASALRPQENMEALLESTKAHGAEE
jgi:branched-subunit amino acid transport protein AzlD